MVNLTPRAFFRKHTTTWDNSSFALSNGHLDFIEATELFSEDNFMFSLCCRKSNVNKAINILK